MEKKIDFTDYKELFTKLYNELEEIKNELNTIHRECSYEEILSICDHILESENDETEYINSSDNLPIIFMSEMVEADCDEENAM